MPADPAALPPAPHLAQLLAGCLGGLVVVLGGKDNDGGLGALGLGVRAHRGLLELEKRQPALLLAPLQEKDACCNAVAMSLAAPVRVSPPRADTAPDCSPLL